MERNVRVAVSDVTGFTEKLLQQWDVSEIELISLSFQSFERLNADYTAGLRVLLL
jgi:hypothetical protein